MPQPRVTLKRAIAYLEQHGETQAGKLSTALGVTPGTLTSAVIPGVLEGDVVRRKDGHHCYYSRGDGTVPKGTELAEEEADEFNAALWADGDLVLFGVTLNDDQTSITLGPRQVQKLRQLLGA